MRDYVKCLQYGDPQTEYFGGGFSDVSYPSNSGDPFEHSCNYGGVGDTRAAGASDPKLVECAAVLLHA